MANLSRRKAESEPMRTFDPFRLMRDMMRLDPFGDLLPTIERQVFAPSVEVRENKDEFVFCADLPGVKKDDLDVSVTGNRLTISGKRESDVTDQDEADRYYAYERSYGTFSRSFTLPEGADLENLDAQLKDGVLRIGIPKRPEVQTKKIDIKATESPPEAETQKKS
jgi:HSP20 family protein